MTKLFKSYALRSLFLKRLYLEYVSSRKNFLPNWGEIVSKDQDFWDSALERAQNGPNILVATNTGGHVPSSTMEGLLAVALVLRGANVHVMLCDEALPACMLCTVNLYPGYWITRIAHRIPVANPSQDPKPIKETASVFLSQNESAARDLIRQTKTGYVIADDAMVTSKFWAIAQWNGQDRSDYYGIYFIQQGNQVSPKTFYYPEYYNSLLVRLYNFDGKAVTPDGIEVISYKDQAVQDPSTGERFSVSLVTDNQTFTSYQQAVDFINSHPGSRIVSDNPFVSAVPLGTLIDYRLVFTSEQASLKTGSIRTPQVKIFEVKTP